MKLTFVLIFNCLVFCCNAQQSLVGVQDGQWFTFTEGNKTLLPRDIHDVGNFDNQKLAYFMRHDRYGLIDPNGAIVLDEKYIAVEQLKGGYYKFLRKNGLDLVQFENGELKFTNCRFIKNLENNWYRITTDSNRFILNTSGNKQFQLNSLDKVINLFYGHLFLKREDDSILFNPKGEQIEFGENPPQFSREYLLLMLENSKKIIYPDHEIVLPNDAVNIEVGENEIHYTTGGVTRIVSAINQRLIIEVKCESLESLGRGLYQMKLNNKVGVISKEGKIIAPMVYNFVSIRDNYLIAENANGAGVLDLSGEIILPCFYDWVTPFRDFFLVESDMGREGLFSRKTNKIILPCAYKRILFSDLKVRAWSGDKLRILELDSMHTIKSDLVLDNVITLDKMKASDDINVDNRLYGLGWFSNSEPFFDSLGFKIGDKTKWGLKGLNDTTLLSARYKEPIFVPQADFSLVPGPVVISELSNKRQKTKTFYVTSHLTGKKLVPEGIFSLDTMDLFSRSYTRFYGTKGFGFLTAENKVVHVQYIDGFDRRYVRYCQSENPKAENAEENEFNHLRCPDGLMNNNSSRTVNYTVNKINWKYVKFVGAEWNFLDTNGQAVFDKPFSFVYPYRRNTAIVQQDGKWGLTRADSLVLKPIYSQLSRMSEISDTLILAKLTPEGMRFMDTTTRELPIGITRFGLSKGSLTQVYFGSKKGVINSNYEFISGATRFQKLFSNDLFYSKENKKYTIYSNEGVLLGTIKQRPQDFVRDEFVVIAQRGKKGIVDMFNEVIVPSEYKEIQLHGDYILAINGFDNKLYDKEFNVIRKCKNYSVLVDESTGNYAVIEPSRGVVFSSASGKKIGSWKGTKFEKFCNGWLIQYGKISRAIDVASERVVLFDFEIKEVIDMDGAGYLVYDTKKTSHHYSANWEEVNYEQPLKRAKYVGEGRGICKTKNGLLLFGDGVEKLFPTKSNFIGTFNNGFLLLGSGNHYVYVNESGDNIFKREFMEATPFGLNCATIRERSGWTIMGVNGHYKTLPSFDKIEEVGANIFTTTKQALFGVFDSHGNNIVPVEYQKINIINKNLLQGYKNGEIFYFNISGEEIEL